jgi:hypothetical protein
MKNGPCVGSKQLTETAGANTDIAAAQQINPDIAKLFGRG